jgi:tetratricopeptide (TPR) repeat protein
LFLIASLLASAPTQAAWREARSAHFIIYSEDKPDALRAFATDLERYDAAMRVLRGLPNGTDSPNNRLTVYQVTNIAAVQKLYGTKGGMLAGFYDGRAGGSIAFVPRKTGATSRVDMSSETVLLHEYAHHFMFRNYPAAFPVWFSEGYAEFNSTARFVADGSVDLGMPAQHRAMGLVYLAPLPIEDLLASNLDKLSAEGTESLYGRGWLLTHYLYFNKEREGQLGKYLAAINKGKTSLDAAREAFGDLGQLNRELDRYIKVKMQYLRIPANKISIGPIEVRDLSPGANAIMPIHMRSRRGVTDQQAQEVVKKARELAAPYPDDPFVQLALAEAEIDAGNLAECDQAADRVLAADPKSVRAMVFKGRVAMKRLADAKDAKDEDWKAGRRWFVRANHADPDAPEPLIFFYQSFLDEGVTPTPNAVVGLQTASALAPEDEFVRLTLAHQYLIDKKLPEARAALATAAYDPHGGPIADAAGRVIAALDKDGAAAALKAWDVKPEEAKAAAASH